MNGTRPTGWDDAIQGFADHVMNQYTPSSAGQYLRYVRMFAEGRKDSPADVQPLELPSFVNRPSWGPPSRKVAQQALRAFFNWAASSSLISTDPSAAWKPLRAPRKRGAVATRAEILDAQKNASPDVALMIALMSEAGLSPAQIAQARRRDVRTTGNKYEISVSPRESVLITGRLARKLLARPDGYLFPGAKGGHFGEATISRYVSGVLPPGVTARSIAAYHRQASTGRRVSDDGARHARGVNASRLRTEVDFMDPGELLAQLDAIESEIEASPARAIGDCKVLLESLFDAVLVERRARDSVGENPKLGAYYAAVARALNVDADRAPARTDADESIRTILRTLATTVHELALVRNEIGRHHGSATPSPAERRHGFLAFNATMTVAEWVLDNWVIVLANDSSRPPDAPRG